MAPSSRAPVSKSKKNFISEDFVGKDKQYYYSFKIFSRF